MLTGFTSLTKSKIGKGTSDYNQRKCDLSLLNCRCQINHNYSPENSSALEAIYQPRIAQTKFAVNVKKSLVTNEAIIQTTTKLEDTADKTFNCDLLVSFRGNINLDFNRLLKMHQYV